MASLAASSNKGIPGNVGTTPHFSRTKYSIEDGAGDQGMPYADALAQCFGPKPHGMPTDLIAARRPYEAYFLPDAYKGRSDYLLTTIIDEHDIDALRVKWWGIRKRVKELEEKEQATKRSRGDGAA